MARPRKPTALKLLHGDFDKDPQRRNHKEPEPVTEIPACPGQLGVVGRNEWKRICSELELLKVISLAERASILRYCHAYQQHHDYERQAKKDGRWQVNDRGVITEHPASKAARDLVNQMIKLLVALGLTPTSRTRLAVNEKKNVNNDEQYFFGDSGTGS